MKILGTLLKILFLN